MATEKTVGRVSTMTAGTVAMLTAVGALMMAALLIAAQGQIYDSNLYQLSEVPAILNGDHPYRDFFEWGAPLTAYLSAGAQLLVGYRLIGEFGLQWALIVAGGIVSFCLALELSGSRTAALLVLPVQVLLLLQTPTYHFLKLFVFPVMLALSFRYLREPTRRNSLMLGAGTAIGFLLRNDFGVWLLVLWLLTLGVSAWHTGDGFRSKRLVSHAVGYGVAAAVTLAPWAVLVQSGEGLLRYVTTRTTEFERPGDWPFVYRRLLDPRRFPIPNFLVPAVRPGRVEFEWKPRVSAGQRLELVRQSALTPVGAPAAEGRQVFDVANLDDPGIRRLVPFIEHDRGFDWLRLHLLRSSLATTAGALLWMQWVMLLVPLVMLLLGISQARRAHGSADARMDAARCVVAGGYLVLLLSVLLRQDSYIVMFAPLVSALAARLLSRRAASDDGPRRMPLVGRGLRVVSMAVVAVTFAATLGYSAQTLPFTSPAQIPERVSTTLRRMVASPPLQGEPSFEYVRECSNPGDRVLITGPTPYQVSYFTQRPMAGGHFLWHYGWQSDAVGEARSLELLKSQSVPFVLSTSDSGSAVRDFAGYDGIREYLAANYAELPGTNGRLLVDARRPPVRLFGESQLPCFAARQESPSPRNIGES